MPEWAEVAALKETEQQLVFLLHISPGEVNQGSISLWDQLQRRIVSCLVCVGGVDLSFRALSKVADLSLVLEGGHPLKRN